MYSLILFILLHFRVWFLYFFGFYVMYCLFSPAFEAIHKIKNTSQKEELRQKANILLNNIIAGIGAIEKFSKYKKIYNKI